MRNTCMLCWTQAPASLHHCVVRGPEHGAGGHVLGARKPGEGPAVHVELVEARLRGEVGHRNRHRRGGVHRHLALLIHAVGLRKPRAQKAARLVYAARPSDNRPHEAVEVELGEVVLLGNLRVGLVHLPGHAILDPTQHALHAAVDPREAFEGASLAPARHPPQHVALLFATDQRTAAVALTGISNPIAGSARCAEHRPGDGLGVVGFAVFGAENFNLCLLQDVRRGARRHQGSPAGDAAFLSDIVGARRQAGNTDALVDGHWLV
mmetsp:Transcript_56316/g.134380  ORF Transcript_56316/g.134380 Transcript_56316/m.134380 type:complete len:265 (+) Transcript_56316:411-1205(+)